LGSDKDVSPTLSFPKLPTQAGCTASHPLTRGKILTQMQQDSNRKRTIAEIVNIMKNGLQESVEFSSKSRRKSSSPDDCGHTDHPAWKAFLAGMQVLQRYANRSTVSIQAVAESNLRLLHRSLRFNKDYRREVENLLHDTPADGLPVLRHLYTCQGLSADLLALQDGTSINLTSLPQSYAMYLLIAGNAQLESANPEETSAKSRARQAWWQRIIFGGKSNILRNGDAIIRCIDQKPVRLTGFGKSCLLLRVRTPMVDTAYRIAS